MMNDMGYNFCTQCGEKVAKESFFCTSCGHKLRTEDIPSTDGIYEKIKDKKGMSKVEKAAISIAILLPLIMAITVFCIIYIPQAEIKNTYADLKEAMHIGNKGLYEVEDLLEKLPDDYRDVKKIRKEYEEIAANITVIANEGLTPDNAWLARAVFLRFQEIEEKNNDWEITDYLAKRHTDLLVFDLHWVGKDDYFLWFFYPDDEYDSIITSLPGKMMEMEQSTYYYELTGSGLILGYTDPKTGEKVKQYEVISIDYVDNDWHMEMYCYEDDTIYAFEPHL